MGKSNTKGSPWLNLQHPWVVRTLQRSVVGHFQPHGQPQSGIGWVNDGVYPQTCCRVVRSCLRVVPGTDLIVQRFFGLRVGRLIRARLFNLQQHLGRLLAAHDGQLGGGPSHNQTGIVGLSAHGVVSGAVGVPYDDRKLRNHAVGYRVDHLGAVFDDAAVLAPGSYHEAGDVLEKHQGYLFLVAIRNKTSGLVRGIAVNDTANLHFTLA